MSIWNLKAERIVGIDISSTAVKLLELSQSGKKRYKVESYAIERLPEKSIEDKNIVPDKLEDVGTIIGKLVKKAKPIAQHAAVAVAGPAVITKTINMDGDLSDQEMKDEIEEEPAQYLGQDNEEEISFDFQVIGPNEKEPERVDILLAACSSEILEARTTVLEMGGLKTKIVDIEKYALENAFLMLTQNDPEINEDETIALIEIGATTTMMSVLGEQKIIYTNEEMFGGKQLTETVQTHYGLNSYEEAEFAQRSGELGDDYEKTHLEPFKDEMAQQISRMVQYYYASDASSHYGKLSHILIAGGCASIPNIIEPINNKVGGHVTIVNPFAQMSIASRVRKKDLMNNATALMTVCGLALRTFDEK
ncbi:MAG: type IV pilus assembly protein PilM [Thiomargarita sp.]|nr:type IV pilus assembly protein PilM [Thiomargarita sp.]